MTARAQIVVEAVGKARATERPPHLLRAPADRLAQFAAGRACARRALRAAGAVDVDVGVGACGEPLWPRGFIGSIAHTPSLACAAAARADDACGVGIDVEGIARGEALSAIRSLSLDAREAALVDSPELVTVAFSAKESVYKCLAPIVRARFDFADVRLVAVYRGRLRFVLARALGVAPRGLELEARFAVSLPAVLTWVVLDVTPALPATPARASRGPPGARSR